MANHYGVFWGEDAGHKFAMWARASNRLSAESAARKVGGYVVRLSYGKALAWDAPTFKVCGDVVADFRKGVR